MRDALARIAGLAKVPLAFTPPPDPYGYRGRARLRVERGAVGFRRRCSHELCAISSCPLLAPPLDRALATLAESPPGKGAREVELALGEAQAFAPSLAAGTCRT